MEHLNQLTERLNKYAVKIPPIVQAADATGQKPGLILLAAIVLMALLVLIFMGGQILMVVLTVVYPGVQSIKALESKNNDEDDKVWLTYWVVFGIFTLLDEWLGFLLAYIPFYFYIRLGFFLYLMLPQTKGAKTVYEKGLRPLLQQN